MTELKTWRFRLGRWLMHLGLHIFPESRAKNELHIILKTWGDHVERSVRNAKADGRRVGPS